MKNKLQLKNGLLYTSLNLRHKGKSIIVDNVIVDTGAFHTIIITDFLDDIGAEFSNDDQLIEASGYGGTTCYAVRKRIDTISCNDIKLKNFKIDFGEIHPNERINGLLGLDFLEKAGMILDLVDFVMYKK
ncbi:retropepsin-like aspartic protease [Clostridium uliginosum]|uniref:Aspartyl protease n=1 Tax=Clostridium uliginosum TaxID=119641 RepID=A0A1I1SH59_9CLOT|nr:retropepsin-like aspartic protease [Clostridium uliginosum]SFD45771.1 Aspartyl protease [Clostridium uliginosum]